MNTPTTSKKTILIIEDEEAERHVLHDKLIHEGFTIFEAKDGEEGFTIALREHPDLILLDIMMPKMDGMTMMDKLREDAWGKKASIIILTNFDANEERLAKVVTDQPSYYLIKANTPLDKILEKIQEALNSKK